MNGYIVYIIVGAILAIIMLSVVVGMIVDKAMEETPIVIDNIAEVAEADSLADSTIVDHFDCDCLVCLEREKALDTPGHEYI